MPSVASELSYLPTTKGTKDEKSVPAGPNHVSVLQHYSGTRLHQPGGSACQAAVAAHERSLLGHAPGDRHRDDGGSDRVLAQKN